MQACKCIWKSSAVGGKNFIKWKCQALTQYVWATSQENLFMPLAKNKGAYQPACLRGLISAFVVRCLDSTIPELAISKISRLLLVSVDEQTGLNLIILPEHHGSCIAHLSAEDMLKWAVFQEKKLKHSPWAGTNNQLGPKFLCQQEGLITMVICCKSEKNLWLYTHLFII